jgi:hypothetical protein
MDIGGGAQFSSPAVREAVMRATGLSAPLGPTPSGSGNVTINQKTDISVTASDPSAAGKAVANEQSRVNAQMATVVRNSQGGVR